MVWIPGIPLMKGIVTLGDTRFESQQLTISWIQYLLKHWTQSPFLLRIPKAFFSKKMGDTDIHLLQVEIYENILFMLYQATVPTGDQLSQTSGDHPSTWGPILRNHPQQKAPLTFHCTGCLIGILIVVHILFQCPTELGSIIPWKPSTTSCFLSWPTCFSPSTKLLNLFSIDLLVGSFGFLP